MASPKLNRTYLCDRVQKEMHDALYRNKEKGEKEVSNLRAYHLTTIKADEPALQRLNKRKEALEKKLNEVRDELKALSTGFEQDYPYLYLNPDTGTISFKQYNYNERIKPTPIDGQIAEIRKEYDEKQQEIRDLCTAFMDKIMMGEATYEEFSSLITALGK